MKAKPTCHFSKKQQDVNISAVVQLTSILNDPGIPYKEMKAEYFRSKLNKKKQL